MGAQDAGWREGLMKHKFTEKPLSFWEYVMKTGECRVCGKHPLTGKDYFQLCRKCQPAWHAGFLAGIQQCQEKLSTLYKDLMA